MVEHELLLFTMPIGLLAARPLPVALIAPWRLLPSVWRRSFGRGWNWWRRSWSGLSVFEQGQRLHLAPSLQSVSNPAVYGAGGTAAVGPMLTTVLELDAEVVAENLPSDGAQRVPHYLGIPSVVFTIHRLVPAYPSEGADLGYMQS